MLTALLMLAILASSTLVFTNRVELLRLAVILSLWAAVLAAFVSVVYRRQSQLDEARARDMKFVYDLQLDREISARREYELSVEAHLRRQLGQEVRAQAADEMAALRAELMSLRSHLEALLGTDLGERPALAFDRVAEPRPQPIAMPMPPPPDRVESSRVTEVIAEEVTTRVEIVEEVVREVVEDDSPIIDVPEEPLAPPPPPPPPVPPVRPSWTPAAADEPSWATHRRPEPPLTPWRPPETETRRGRHWTPEVIRPASAQPPAQPPAPPTPAPPPAAPPPRGRHWSEPAAASPAPSEEDADIAQGQHTGGHSVADLLARLQVDGRTGGGGRRRRED